MTGQSNAIANAHFVPALSTVDEHPNGAVTPGDPDGTTDWSPLTGDLVNNREWPGAALGYRVYEHALAAGYATRVACDPAGGFTGRTLAQLSKDLQFFKANCERIGNAVLNAKQTGDRVVLRAVHLIQGEADDLASTDLTVYRAQLAALRTDYKADAKGRTGQTEDVELILDQVPAWDTYHPSGPYIGLAQLAEHIANPHVHLVGGRYQLEGHATDDNIHYSNVGGYHLGELHARVFNKVVIDGGTWEPLRPLSAVLAGAVITVEFTVPVAPLIFDTTTVVAQTNMGFSYFDDGTPPAISSVALGGNGTSVVVTLASAPSGANKKIRYGFLSQYGNLADSDPGVSARDGVRLRNWCVHFEQAVT